MGAIRKLSLTINAFDASELLETLISQIRDQVDYVAAFWQAAIVTGKQIGRAHV